MRLARNIGTAMAGGVVAVVINLVALPFYLALLGMEAYGLIGFYVTLQSVLQVLDLGLAPTISREVARSAGTEERRRAASLLRSLGLVYVAMALAMFTLVAWAAPLIARSWLQAVDLPAASLVQALTLMGANLACRWPIGLYNGALAGAHRLAWSSLTTMATNVSAAVATIATLTWIDTAIESFFAVQAVFGLIHVLVLRSLAWRAVGDRDAPRDFRALLRVWNFAAWMTGVAVAGLLLSQIDKLVLSRVLDLEQFGQYMLATLAASGLSLLTMPVYAALFPKFSSLLARPDIPSLEYLYRVGTRCFTVAIFALASLLIFQADPLLELWLRDPALAAEVAPVVALLALGSAINGVMHLPYTLQLAAGQSRLAFSIAASLLCLMVPLTLVLARVYGPEGGALAWLCLNLVYALLGTGLTGRVVMAFAGWRWLLTSAALPALAALLPPFVGAWACSRMALGAWPALATGLISAAAGVALGLAVSFSAGEIRQVALMALGRMHVDHEKA